MNTLTTLSIGSKGDDESMQKEVFVEDVLIFLGAVEDANEREGILTLGIVVREFIDRIKGTKEPKRTCNVSKQKTNDERVVVDDEERVNEKDLKKIQDLVEAVFDHLAVRHSRLFFESPGSDILDVTVSLLEVICGG